MVPTIITKLPLATEISEAYKWLNGVTIDDVIDSEWYETAVDALDEYVISGGAATNAIKEFISEADYQCQHLSQVLDIDTDILLCEFCDTELAKWDDFDTSDMIRDNEMVWSKTV